MIARVRDAETQELLSTWYLLTNVDAASAELVALWYYWRWNIESYFKLMKSAGMELDHWQLACPVNSLYRQRVKTSLFYVYYTTVGMGGSPCLTFQAIWLEFGLAFLVKVAQLVRASDCGSEGRGFESPLSP